MGVKVLDLTQNLGIMEETETGRVGSASDPLSSRLLEVVKMPEPTILTPPAHSAPSKPKPYYSYAGIEIYHGDCREILPALHFDAILTDPPYDIGASSGIGKYGRIRAKNEPRWDESAVDLSHLPECPRIIWGGNYFKLSPSRMYVVWDKGAGFAGRDFAECEQAWCSWDGNAKIYRRDPLACRDYIGKEHPTEKPVPLFQWCMGLFKVPLKTVADPYCGSGTTLIAAKNLGIQAVGIELEERYCEVAARRLSQEVMDFGYCSIDAPPFDSDEVAG